MGARLPVLTLSAEGALAVEAAAVPVGTLATTAGAGTGAVYVLMARDCSGTTTSGVIEVVHTPPVP